MKATPSATSTLHIVAAHLLLFAYPAFAVEATTPNSSPADVYGKSLGKTPLQAIEQFEIKEPANGADFFTLALAYYAKADFRLALDSANRALPLSGDDKGKALCFELIAQCHGALKDYDLAADAALRGQRLNSQSKEMAALRLAYTKEAKDALGEIAAQESLMQLDPEFQKEPKCDPVTGLVIIVGIVCATYFSSVVQIANAKDPQVAKILAESLNNLLDLAKPEHLLTRF